MKGRSIGVVIIRAPNNRLETHLTMISKDIKILVIQPGQIIEVLSIRDEALERAKGRPVVGLIGYLLQSRPKRLRIPWEGWLYPSAFMACNQSEGTGIVCDQ
jgi:hypothetical protein